MYKKEFINWLKNNNLSKSSINGYIDIIEREYPTILQSKQISEVEQIKNEYFEIKENIEKNKRGNNKYSASINNYIKFLNDQYSNINKRIIKKDKIKININRLKISIKIIYNII